MPSSSLLLRSCATFFFTSNVFFLSAHAANNDGLVYVLATQYMGSSFFDDWDFFDQADPNKGFVTYVNRSAATTENLISFDNGDAIMRVDSTNTYNPNSPYYGNNGYGRPSVRITTQQVFDHGLFIADVKHMPGGQCGTWPAFWALGADGNWPYSGEIDIVEGVNNRQMSLAALHTGGQCTITGDSRTMTGSLQSNDCQYDVATGANAAGCDILDTDALTYGSGLNGNGGAVFAMEWTSDAIKIWAFESQSVPTDIGTGTPDPSLWGLPAQIFNGPDCDIDSVIGPQKIVFNTNFCGDFGEAVWSSEGCAAQTGYSTCANYVANNPAAFADAYWQIGSLKYFQKQTVATGSSSVTTTPSTSASLTPTTLTTLVPTTSVSVSGNLSITLVGSVTATISSTITNQISPVVISTSSAQSDSVEPTALTSAIPQSSLLLQPMGSAVPVAAGWNAIDGSENWESLPAASTEVWTGWSAAVTTTQQGVPSDMWASWSNTATTTTIMTTWVEPCPTGYTTRTTYFVTVHCGCTETPVPTIPMKVLTTTCPEAWGFTTPVLITVPAPPTPTPTPSWLIWPAQPTGQGSVAQTWPVWNAESNTYSVNSATWNTWTASTPVLPTTQLQWLPLTASETSVSPSGWSGVPQMTTPAAITAEWNTLAAPTPAIPIPTYSPGWTNSNGNSNPYIAEYKGAATKTSIGMGVVAIAVTVAALIF